MTQSEYVYVWDFIGEGDLATWFANWTQEAARTGLPYVSGSELKRNDVYKIQLTVGIDVPGSSCGIAPGSAEEQLVDEGAEPALTLADLADVPLDPTLYY